MKHSARSCEEHEKNGISLVLRIGVFWLSVVLWNNFAYGGRPLATEDAGVVPHGKAQIETSFDDSREGMGDRSYAFLVTPIYGLFNRFELSTEIPFVITRPEEGENEGGLSDINLVTKSLFIREGKVNPAVLLRSYVKLATGSDEKGFGSGEEDVGLVGVLTKDIKPFTLHANVGYVFVGGDKNMIPYAFACEYSLTDKAKIVGEWAVETNSHVDADGFHHDTFNPLVGLTYQLTRFIALDTAFRVGIADEKKTEYSMTVGLTLNLF